MLARRLKNCKKYFVLEEGHFIVELLRTGLDLSNPSVEKDPLGYVVTDAARRKGLGWRQQVSLEQGLQKLQGSL
jgi:hypothetical protein